MFLSTESKNTYILKCIWEVQAMASIKRTLYVYNIIPMKYASPRYIMPDDVLEDINIVMSALLAKKEIDRKKDFERDKKIIYIDSLEYEPETRVLVMNFISAKYNTRRSVVDTETMEEKGFLKGDRDGDKERNHIAFKYSDAGYITCLYEYNSNGIGCKKILMYIEDMLQEFHQEQDDNIKYRIDSKNMVSLDFINSLEKMHKIKAVTLTVDHEDVKISDAKRFSGRTDISQDVDIVLHKDSPMGIFRKTVEDFFTLYQDKNKVIKRISVEGDDIDDGHFTFNTEQMKEKVIVDVNTEIGTGEVKSSEMIRILQTEIARY